MVSYKSSPDYTLLPLGKDFKSSDTATSLSTSSNTVRAVGGGGTSCSSGLSAVGGYGTYYADAMTAAQSNLTTTGRSGVQKVIILLSDGDANATSANMPTGKATNQCHEAITAAQAAATAGTWVYTVAYGASTSSTGSCSTDTTTHISACSTLQQMASNAQFFYSDNSGEGAGRSATPPRGRLATGLDLQEHQDVLPDARLLPDNYHLTGSRPDAWPSSSRPWRRLRKTGGGVLASIGRTWRTNALSLQGTSEERRPKAANGCTNWVPRIGHFSTPSLISRNAGLYGRATGDSESI